MKKRAPAAVLEEIRRQQLIAQLGGRFAWLETEELEREIARRKITAELAARPVGPVMRMAVVSTGKVKTFSIPKWAQAQKKAQRKRRRP